MQLHTLLSRDATVKPKTLTTRQSPPAGRMSVAPLADYPEKCGRTTPCST